MKGVCANCGADAGLHRYDTMQCPQNGIEETRWDRLTGKWYPQQWQDTVFYDAGEKKLNDAAPDLFEALKELLECDYTSGTHLYTAQIRARAAISKATQ